MYYQIEQALVDEVGLGDALDARAEQEGDDQLAQQAAQRQAGEDARRQQREAHRLAEFAQEIALTIARVHRDQVAAHALLDLGLELEEGVDEAELVRGRHRLGVSER